MLPYFPTPYPDELFYNLCGRYHKWSRNLSVSWSMEDLFGNNKISKVSIDFPTYLSNLCEKLSKQTKVNADILIKEYTLAPFYKPFLTKERSTSLDKHMKGKKKNNSAKIIAGIISNYIPDTHFLRFCPKCIIHDRKKYGEAYWHRTHQISSVHVCPIHKVYLINSHIEKTTPRTLVLLEEELNIKVGFETKSCSNNHLQSISEDIYYLLSNDIPVLGLKNLKERYLELLRAKEFVTLTGQIRSKQFLKEFRQFYGEDTLRILNMPEIKNDNKYWLSRIFSSNPPVTHPIFHLLLIKFLGVSLKEFFSKDKTQHNKPFGSGPWICLNPIAKHYMQPVIEKLEVSYNYKSKKYSGTFYCECGFVYIRPGPDKSESDKYKKTKVKAYGEQWENKLIDLIVNKKKSYRESGTILKVSHDTVKTQLTRILKGEDEPFIKRRTQYRSRWEEVKVKNEGLITSELSKIAKKEARWLSLYDREWFSANSPPKKHAMNITAKDRKKSKKINWEKRDNELVNMISTMIDDIKTEEDKPIRISVASIGKRIRKLIIFRKQLDRLPRTKELLNSVVETREDYLKRKVTWAIKNLIKNDEPLSKSKIVLKINLKKPSATIHQFIESELISYTQVKMK